MKYRAGGGGTVGGLLCVGEAVSRAPPELQEWLDAKLEQVGVDPSPTYARYVLGLLLQPEGNEEDTGADDEEDIKGSNEIGRRQGKSLLETPIKDSWHGECPSTKKDVKVTTSELGKSRKRSRASTGRYDGMFGDGESRKRTAAIDCLMSASDQKVGIEKIVDELCQKLKHIQNDALNDTIFHMDISQSSEGPQRNATKCTPQDQAEKYYAAFPPLKKLGDKSAKIGMTQSFNDECAWNNRKLLPKCIGRNKKKEGWLLSEQMKDFWIGDNVKRRGRASVNETAIKWGMRETGLKGNIGGRRHLRAPYQKARHEQNKFYKEYGHEKEDGSSCKTDPVRMVLMMALASSSKMQPGSTQRYSLGESELDEPVECDKQYVNQRLNELRKNEWEGDYAVDKKYPMACDSDEECLASLFAKFDHRMEALWEFEPKNVSSKSYSLVANMPSSQKIKAINSKSPPNYSIILSGTNITNSIWSHCPINVPLSSCSMRSPGSKEMIGDRYNGSRIVGNELKRLSMKTSPDLENFRIIWKESTEFFPHQFIGMEKVSETLKMKDAERDGILLSSHTCYQAIIKGSLEALNHSSERSSFTEVIPHVSLKCHSCARPVGSKPPLMSCPSVEATKLNPEVIEVEEDLLTSARTHFLPIRRMSVDSSSGMSESNSGGGVNYEDGTTFSIHSTMEKVSFYRSDSGNLLLKEEPEDGFGSCKTPKKYMVYKGSVGFKGHAWLHDQDDSGFLPKFLVRQNEKSCQTDGNDEHLNDVGDSNCCYIKIRPKEDEEATGEEFFFPGDAHLASDLDSMDEEFNTQASCDKIKMPNGFSAPVHSNKSIGEEILADSWSTFPSIMCCCSASSLTNASDNSWDQKDCNHQCWNKIWRPSTDAQHSFLHEVGVLRNSPKCNDSYTAGEVELQSRLLRQELYEESEQLFADLHMVREMQMDWIDGMDQEDPRNDEINEQVEKEYLSREDIPFRRKRNLLGKESDQCPQATLEKNSISSNNRENKIPNVCCMQYGVLEGPVEQMDRILRTAVPKVTSNGMFFSIEAEWKKEGRSIDFKASQNECKKCVAILQDEKVMS